MIQQPTVALSGRYAHRMTEASSLTDITIRPALSRDADGITLIYLESAEYHAGLDAERYWIPDAAAILARYREGQQHPPNTREEAITLVGEMDSEIVGFVDARLTRSPDPMHREMLYCHIVEIAVSRRQSGPGRWRTTTASGGRLGTRARRAARFAGISRGKPTCQRVL